MKPHECDGLCDVRVYCQTSTCGTNIFAASGKKKKKTTTGDWCKGREISPAQFQFALKLVVQTSESTVLSAGVGVGWVGGLKVMSDLT